MFAPALATARSRMLSPLMSPTAMDTAKSTGSTLTDTRGLQYLDALAGLFLVNVGHGRSEIGEAMARQAAKLRTELLCAGASPLERLLVERVALCWLAACAAEIEAAHLLRTLAGSAPAVAAATKRLGQAQQRLLAAIKVLALVRKLVRPSPSPLDLLAGPAGVRQVPPGRNGRPPAAAVGRG